MRQLATFSQGICNHKVSGQRGGIREALPCVSLLGTKCRCSAGPAALEAKNAAGCNSQILGERNADDAQHKNKNKLHKESFSRTGSDVRFNPGHDFRAYHNTGIPR